MRKILLAILSILVLAATVYVIIAGMSFAGIKGYKDISVLNKELDDKIESIEKIKEVEYAAKEKSLNQETTKLKETREDYLAKVEAARVKGAKGAKVQLEIYELDFIWARIGNYATELKLELKLDVFSGAEEKALNDFKLYNLKFTVVGAYTDMVRFIYKIEGDNEIAAQISDFTMKPASVPAPTGTNTDTETTSNIVTLSSEFTLKNIPLNHKNIIDNSTPKTDNVGLDNIDNSTPKTDNVGLDNIDRTPTPGSETREPNINEQPAGRDITEEDHLSEFEGSMPR